MLVIDPGEVGALAGVLEGHPAQVATLVEIDLRAFVEVASLSDLCIAKLDVQSVRIVKVPDLHGFDLQSKKSLAVVSRAG